MSVSFEPNLFSCLSTRLGFVCVCVCSWLFVFFFFFFECVISIKYLFVSKIERPSAHIHISVWLVAIHISYFFCIVQERGKATEISREAAYLRYDEKPGKPHTNICQRTCSFVSVSFSSSFIFFIFFSLARIKPKGNAIDHFPLVCFSSSSVCACALWILSNVEKICSDDGWDESNEMSLEIKKRIRPLEYQSIVLLFISKG